MRKRLDLSALFVLCGVTHVCVIVTTGCVRLLVLVLSKPVFAIQLV